MIGSNSSSPCVPAFSPSEALSVQALASLLLVEENRKLFLAEDWGIIGLVLLLDTRLQEVRKQFPVAALQALAGNAKCRKQMVTAGACYHLRLLSDMEVRGAKRLLDRLVTGKIRNMLTKTLLVSIRNCTLAPILIALSTPSGNINIDLIGRFSNLQKYHPIKYHQIISMGKAKW